MRVSSLRAVTGLLFRAFLAALALGSRCGAAAAGLDLPELKVRGTLRALVTSEEYVEWFALQDSESPGFERELLKGFAELQRMKLEVVVREDFDTLIPSLIAGRGDVIPSLNDTDVRRERISFTVEVLPVHHVAMSRKPQEPPRTLEDLRSRRVAVVCGHDLGGGGASPRAGQPDRRLRAHGPGDGGPDQGLGGHHRGGRLGVPLAEAARPEPRGRRAGGGAPLRRLGPAQGRRGPQGGPRQYLRLKQQSASWSRLVVKYFGPDALAILDRATRP